ncbi:MAG: leucyl/phenylalanyl-tRNA--protein transferase [Ignavibacteriales bacterium]|nr:leucyl/phenylalanyl-tRNA--protein transferase [Ignavibacteriales bacterium]
MIEPRTLLSGYAAGVFPMAEPKSGKVEWFSPDPRGIIELDDLNISRSLRQVIRKKTFEIRFDTAFENVMRACAARDETWISEEIVQSYVNLHRLGWAHSVETWQGSQLAGGLYGVSLGAAFFGESMFSRVRNASKVALVVLVERLRRRGFTLLDTQYLTPHLASMGGKEIPRNDYLDRLSAAIRLPRAFA